MYLHNFKTFRSLTMLKFSCVWMFYYVLTKDHVYWFIWVVHYILFKYVSKLKIFILCISGKRHLPPPPLKLG